MNRPPPEEGGYSQEDIDINMDFSTKEEVIMSLKTDTATGQDNSKAKMLKADLELATSIMFHFPWDGAEYQI